MAADVLVSRIRDLIEAPVSDDLMALDMQHGHCYGFNSTAARIWSLTGTLPSRSTICAALTKEYDISPERCLVEVAAVLDELATFGLVRLTTC